jgi:hypothetical protein
MYCGSYLPCKRGHKCADAAIPYCIADDFLTLACWGKPRDGLRFYTCAEIEHIIRTELLQYPMTTKYTITLYAEHNTVPAYVKPRGTAVYGITAQSISADGRSIEYSGEAVIDT